MYEYSQFGQVQKPQQQSAVAQHVYVSPGYPTQEVLPPAPAEPRGSSRHSKIAKFFAIVGIVVLVLSYIPQLGFIAAQASGIDTVNQNFAETVADAQANAVERKESGYTPPFDPRLPQKNMLIIPSIGVKTVINEAPIENYEDALQKGVWRVSDFGTPSLAKRPTILAAHRYGYLKWSNDFRRENSFFNLPKLEEGDRVEIIWNQRRYIFEVYAGEQATKLTDYSADLVLFTCNDLSSNVRIARYLKLLEV